MIDYYRCQ